MFEYTDEDNSIKFKLEKKVIENYIDTNALYKKDHPTECSIMNDNYREVLIEYVDVSYSRLSEEVEEIIFGNRKDGIYVRIGIATDCFMLSYLCNENLFKYSELVFYEESEEPLNILKFYYRPLTISINNLNIVSEAERINFSDEMFETCLFELAYFKEDCTNICKSWDDYYEEEEDSDLDDEQDKKSFQLPKVFYNKELTKFYRLGLSSIFPILEYLTYYQILEYFFIDASHEELYEKLSYKLKDPGFGPEKANIAKLVKIMEDHSKKADETGMLTSVLKKFVDFSDLKEFIENYEEEISDKIYTKKNEIFGESVEVDLKEGHIFSNIAKLIKVIRNALVHSSDIREGKKRYVPFSESTEIVENHIPLLKFLAEKVIFATSSSYNI
ncbi:MAG: hypothetical protein ACFFAS_01925 [Promethearchaeota archaeon]